MDSESGTGTNDECDNEGKIMSTVESLAVHLPETVWRASADERIVTLADYRELRARKEQGL